MQFKGKPNGSVIDRYSGKVLVKFDEKGYATVPDEKILKDFETRVNKAGYPSVTLRYCECGEPFEDQGTYMTHCKTCKVHKAAKEETK